MSRLALGLRVETRNELRFAHSHVSGWVTAFLATAGLLVYAGYTEWTLFLRPPFVFVTLVLATLAVLGVVAGLWREQLVVDRRRRTYQFRRGFWPKVSTTRGAMTDFDGVVVRKRTPSGDSGGVPKSSTHDIMLEWQARRPAILLGNATVLTAAQEYQERVAGLLGLQATDRPQVR